MDPVDTEMTIYARHLDYYTHPYNKHVDSSCLHVYYTIATTVSLLTLDPM